MLLAVVVALVAVALIFDFNNGFHDAANSIATVVSTRVLSPVVAVVWAAFFNFISALPVLWGSELKVAYSMGSWNDGGSRWVLLQDMQGTTVARNLPPTIPFGLTPQDRMQFMRQLTTYVTTQSQNHQGQGPGAAPRGGLGSNIPVSVNPPGPQNILNILATVTIPPKVVPQVQAPAPAPARY
jgi:hypothetical protein